jgi:threonine dehydratase
MEISGLPTPLEAAPAALTAGLMAGRALYLKREDVHELGAFKWRGALPVLAAWRERGLETVITASTGNHGAATAWAARRLGMRAIVYAPEGASRAKLELIRSFGGAVRLSGRDMDEAKEIARQAAAHGRVPFFEDGAEPDQVTGYAAIGREIVAQMRALTGAPPGAVIVPVGNGALLAGIGSALGAAAPGAVRVGVVAKEAPVMAVSWEAGRPVECPRCATFADGLAVRVAIPGALEALRGAVDRFVQVSERAIAWGVGGMARAGLRVEGAAAAALAAAPLVDRDPLVLIVTGRNIDEDLHRRAVERPESFPE